ncbi:MAG TPA: hypothetical protein VIM11_21180 [Tepidisphaeraceae bacterium]
MTLLSYTLRPSIRKSLATFFVHHNPFYLLSALCMLAGCYALNNGLGARPGDLAKLLALLGVLNAYEALLIGLGLYLIRRRGIIRDGRTLLLLQAPFLVDLTFLNAEVGSVSLRTGLLLCICVAGLTAIKVGVLLRGLWGKAPARLFCLVMIELAALVMMPCAFSWFDHHGGVTGLQCYAWWWVVGGLVAMPELRSRSEGSGVNAGGLQRAMKRVYLLLPLASLIAHLSMLHWVYRVQFVGADLSPVLLGLMVAIGREAWASRSELVVLRIVMPLAAMTMAINFPPVVYVYASAGLRLTPGEITMAAAYAAVVYCFFGAWAKYLLTGGAAVATVMLFGPSLEQTWFAVAACYRRVVGLADRLVPKSAFEWGVVAMGGAFAFLAMGAAISLKKEKPVEEVLSVDVG